MLGITLVSFCLVIDYKANAAILEVELCMLQYAIHRHLAIGEEQNVHGETLTR